MARKHSNPETILSEVFGFETFKTGQREVVDLLLQDRSALAIFPTGGGKSLCYQLPALMFDGMTIVVSPLIALMKDQIDVLASRGIRAARLDSSLSADETRAVWNNLWRGDLKLLYVAPERFNSERFLQRMRQTRISLMVIDEAHCISEWGHNFRPDYLKLARVSRELGAQRVLALTATATPAVADDILDAFGMDKSACVNIGFHRPNLMMSSTPCTLKERKRVLADRIVERPRGAAIVYVTLQRTAEDVASYLCSHDLPARAYHAGLETDERNEIQDWFMQSEDGIVVATIAFGMGIDKANIRYVYHYNLPKSLEHYMQETGRAGRDGKPSRCDMLVCPNDVPTLENFSYGDTPTLEGITGVVQELLSAGDTLAVSEHVLSRTFDIRPVVVSTLLAYLEMEKVLVSTGPYYDEYRFQPQRPSEQILEAFDPDRVRFLKRLFSIATKRGEGYVLDMSSAAKTLGEPRERLVAAMNYLEERGDLTLKVGGLLRGYRRGPAITSTAALADLLHARFQRSEQRDVARIQQVIGLATLGTCSVRHVLEYFGEVLKHDCGHCDRCVGKARPILPPHVRPRVTPAHRNTIATVIAEAHEALRTPRQLARFFCGLTSPATTHARLTRDKRFGELAHLPFQVVLDLAEQSLFAPAA